MPYTKRDQFLCPPRQIYGCLRLNWCVCKPASLLDPSQAFMSRHHMACHNMDQPSKPSWLSWRRIFFFSSSAACPDVCLLLEGQDSWDMTNMTLLGCRSKQYRDDLNSLMQQGLRLTRVFLNPRGAPNGLIRFSMWEAWFWEMTKQISYDLA